MKYHTHALRLFGVFSLCCFLLSPYQFLFGFTQIHAASPIRLGEIAWAGSSRSTADEWVEIWNLGDQEQSLSGWSLSGAADGDKKIFFPTDAVIPAHGAYLISNYPAYDSKSTLTATPNVVTTTLALSNSTLHLVLQDETNTLIDDTGTSTTPAAGSSLPVKTSMVRNFPDGNWKNTTSAINLVSEITDLGTPGFCDQCTEQQTEPEIETQNPTEQVNETPSSTSPIIIDNTTPVINITPSSTEIGSATSTINTEVITDTNSTTSPQTQNPVATPKPAYGMLRINEFMPAPENGKEWIEIISLDKATSIPLIDCTLHDSNGTIFTFTNEHQLNQTTSTHLLIELSSAKLNNTGDSLSLYAPDGQLLDTTTYNAATKGESYIRYPDSEGNWELTREPTPGITNQRELPEPELIQTTQTSEITNTPITQTVSTSSNPTTLTQQTTTSTAKTISLSKKDQSKKPTTDLIKKSSEKEPVSNVKSTKETSKITNPPATKTTTNKVTKPKTTSSKKIDPIYLLTEDMFTQAVEGGIHVKLFGTVANPPGLLKSHAFILINPEGRGLRVNIPKKFRLPEQGSFLSVAGKLEFDDRNIPRITVATTDKITIEKKIKEKTIQPKSTDLLTVTNEQAWGFIQATGTVLRASDKKLRIDFDGIEADIFLNQPLTYRGSRLDTGDRVQINGLLDLSTEDPRLFPTKNEDIVLLEHAPKKPSELLNGASSKTQYPTWMPIGAAAGMVVVTESAKRLKRHRDLKRLETKLASL